MHGDPFKDHELVLFRRFYPPQQCQDFLNTLISDVHWSEDHYLAFGRRIQIPRRQAWYAEPGIRYSYSNNLLETQAWIEPLATIRRQVESAVERAFNSVLLTYYRDGNDSVSWHADDEAELGPEPWIASLSLGASRDFHYRHRVNSTSGQLRLNNGDLLLMHPGFQNNWEHCVPAQPEIHEPRINLTFRDVTKLN